MYMCVVLFVTGYEEEFLKLELWENKLRGISRTDIFKFSCRWASLGIP